MVLENDEMFKVDAEQPEAVRQYLLGNLTEESRKKIEERLMTDADFFRELLLAEDDLIDDYLANLLSNTQIRNFESKFLITPERIQKVRFARSLRKYVSRAVTESDQTDKGQRHEEEPSPFLLNPVVQKQKKKVGSKSLLPWYAIAAVVVLALFATIWITVSSLKRQVREPGRILAVALVPGMSRESGEITRVSILPQIDTVQLRLEIPKNEYVNYRTMLIGDDRTPIVTSDPVNTTEAGKNFLITNVPATVLNPGDYRMTVSGRSASGAFEDIATYRFRVLRT
jgi:hypothetical protein